MMKLTEAQCVTLAELGSDVEITEFESREYFEGSVLVTFRPQGNGLTTHMLHTNGATEFRALHAEDKVPGLSEDEIVRINNAAARIRPMGTPAYEYEV